jgi:biotin-(acetyl-CoA carboxylase) ligase
MVGYPDSTTGLKLPETVYPPREDTRLMIDSLMGPVNEGGRALEIGSGSGAVSIALAEMGWGVTAIDVNPMAVAATRGNTRDRGWPEVECIEGSFDEIASLRDGMFDLIVWNLPYIGIPSKPPSLEVIEEASMIDAGSGGWASELRAYLMANPSMLSPDGAVLLLYRTCPESPSKPEDWVMDGWATRPLSSLFIGGEILKVIGHWRPGLNERPVHLVEMSSTMDYEFNGRNRFERVFADSQTRGKGRKDAEWITDPDGVAGTWRIPSMGGLSPGILQIGLGAELSSAFNMHLKWPNDVVDRKYRKCGGVLSKLQSDGSVKLGVGMNRYVQQIPGVKVTGWDATLPKMSKSTAICVADAAVASALDVHPLIGSPNSENLRNLAWRRISKVLSRGHSAVVNGIDKRIVGIEEDGRMLIAGKSGSSSISEVDQISWKVAI